MQTRREYAISLGLAKPGRGKLSFAAHEAINKAISEGMVFSDANGSAANTVANVRSTASASGTRKSSNQSSKTDRKVNAGSNSNISNSDSISGVAGVNDRRSRTSSVERTSAKVPQPQKVTHEQSTVWGIDDNGKSTIIIAFDSCAECMRAVKYCVHDVPQLPKWLGGGDSLMEKPNVTHA